MSVSQSVERVEKAGFIRRKSVRRRSYKRGTAAFNHKSSTISCIVRDLSDGGARLQVEGLFRPPHVFDLLVPMDDWEAACEVVWRKDGELGVKFVSKRTKIQHHH